ncbi:MAG: helix-turn-helix transcriptional regulator [Betaproteobacteria bacterium]
MKITDQIVDALILRELGGRLARARLARNLTQARLATQAGVAKRTLERIEAGGSTDVANLLRVCRALGLVERFEALIPEPLPSPVAQLKLRGKERKRATVAKKVSALNEPPAKWTWGDKP